jgi:hypothetical protein
MVMTWHFSITLSCRESFKEDLHIIFLRLILVFFACCIPSESVIFLSESAVFSMKDLPRDWQWSLPFFYLNFFAAGHCHQKLVPYPHRI